jgi:hypothetical protein
MNAIAMSIVFAALSYMIVTEAQFTAPSVGLHLMWLVSFVFAMVLACWPFNNGE